MNLLLLGLKTPTAELRDKANQMKVKLLEKVIIVFNVFFSKARPMSRKVISLEDNAAVWTNHQVNINSRNSTVWKNYLIFWICKLGTTFLTFLRCMSCAPTTAFILCPRRFEYFILLILTQKIKVICSGSRIRLLALKIVLPGPQALRSRLKLQCA